MAGNASKENGKKGGRPKGAVAKSTLEAMVVKELYVEKAKEHGGPIADALITKALGGDIPAIKEFNDRAFGKAPQSIDVTSKGESIVPNDRLKKLAERLNQ